MKDAIDEDTDKAIEQFKKYPILGCKTVLDMARVASGYDPNGNMDDANKEKYQDYVNCVLKCPFFHLVMNKHQIFHRQESSWSEAIKIHKSDSDLFSRVNTKDKDKISQSITNLANAVSSNNNTKQGTSLFSVSVLNSDEQYYAKKVFEKHFKLIEDWLNDNATEPGDEITNCLIRYLYSKNQK